MAKTIKAVFNSGVFARTLPVFEWDTDDKLQFAGIDLPDNYTVDFSNSKTGESKPVLGDASGVSIPPEYLVPGTEIYAWVWISTDNGGFTKYQVTIPIHKRARRTEITPTPAQQDALDQAIALLNNTVEGVEEAIDSALQEAKDSGEFDGPPGTSIWRVDASHVVGHYAIATQYLEGREDTAPAIDDLVIDTNWNVYLLKFVSASSVGGDLIGSIKGETGPQGPRGYTGNTGAAGVRGSLIWSTTALVEPGSGPSWAVPTSSLTGKSGATPLYGDLVIASEPGSSGATTYLYLIVEEGSTYIMMNAIGSIKGATGPQGADGVGVPAGGAAGQVLAKASGTDYDTEWVDQSGGGTTEVFWATYNTTTADEIESAYQAGKLCVVLLDEVLYTMTWRALIEQQVLGGDPIYVKEFKFTALAGGKQKVLRVQGSTWTNTDTTLGTYSKPSGGIPATDLASAVQTSLGKADAALPATGNAYRAASIPMGQLDSTSTATVMTAQVDGITELRDGVCVWLTNGVITSASGFTIDINGLGAKPVYSSLAAATRLTTVFNVNYTMLLVYNSTRVTDGCWDMVYGYDTNTTYTPVKLGFGYTTCSTAESTLAKTAALSSYTLVANGIVSVKFTNAVPAGSTLNIASKGAKAIYYQGAAITDGIIKAGDTATFIYSTYYHLIAIDRQPTAADVGAVAANQGTANAGKFLTVGSDGVVVPVTMTAWQGGNY